MTDYADRVLVAYASSAGSTRSVAEFVAARLRARGVTVEVHSLAERPDPDRYGAIVLGSAVHNGALLTEAEDFIRRNADTLRMKPVWLFSLGLNPSLRGPVGHFLRDVVPEPIADVCELIVPREYRAFAGVVHRGTSPLVARVLLRICGGRYGDLRDWPAIEAWTTGIAAQLHRVVTA